MALLIAISYATVPACVPYIEGCMSISATGRYVPAAFVFKPAMTVEAVLMAFYWIANYAWLRSLHIEQKGQMRYQRMMLMLGIGSAFALVIYVTFLGTQLPIYEFMRRIGVYFYFLFTIIAQIILAINTRNIAKAHQLQNLFAIGRFQLWLALVPFVFGALNLVLKSTLDEPDAAENIIEWLVALLMHINFLLSYFAWKLTLFDFRWRSAING